MTPLWEQLALLVARPGATADAPKVLTASPNENELLALHGFRQTCGHTATAPVDALPPAHTGALPAETPHGQCTPAAVTAVGAPQLSMHINQMIVQTRHHGVHAPHTQALQSQAAKEAHSQKPWRGSAHAV